MNGGLGAGEGGVSRWLFLSHEDARGGLSANRGLFGQKSFFARLGRDPKVGIDE